MISAIKDINWGHDLKQVFRQALCTKESTLQRIREKLSWQRDQHEQRV